MMYLFLQHVLKEQLGFREVHLPKDVWKSVIIISGEQYVMISGVMLMPRYLADSLDFLPLVYMQ